MRRYSLNEADRERLGCPEWIDLDLDDLPIDECIAVEESGGEWQSLIRGGAKGIKARVWLALRRAGVEVDYASLTFSLTGFRTVDDDDQSDEKDAEGKAEPSATSGTDTSQT